MHHYPFLNAGQWLLVIRIVTALLLMAHGCIRVYEGTVNEFGEFLYTNGFPIAIFLAWGITAFEIIGGLLMAAGVFRKVIATIFIFELLMGIILVHASRGWFVVGHSTGGAEYSVLLIVCLLAIAATEPKVGETNY